eukprot:CAMPEP_0113557570 /NCGR_PEP_ID=MMETSP0015_2-20120614/17864_1 /TAXON_ID=2838 /ORGANISM="Odontella" /LENGTH=235 /DNA_ID=CAMNT_0000459009 /DNA_START=84 /DNA_END=791 /DNA_ORIENTATION=- /assembly_acc=CAM_ASM_000160
MRESSSSQSPPSVEVGDIAPNFTTRTVDGKPFSLSDCGGKKVMLCFHRFAACPFCNLAIHQLIGRYKKLAWASRLEVISVFQSPGRNVEKHILGETSASDYPFTLLSDTEHELYDMYNVQSASVLGSLCYDIMWATVSRREMRDVREFRKKISDEDYDEMKQEGCTRLLPANFLIDEDGRVVDCFRARNIKDHIPLERVELFLLGKSKLQRADDRSVEECNKTPRFFRILPFKQD